MMHKLSIKNKGLMIFIIALVILLGYIANVTNKKVATYKSTDDETSEKKIDTLLNTSRYLVLGYSTLKVQQIKRKDTANYSEFFKAAYFNDDVILVNSSDIESLTIFVKNDSFNRFDAYKVPVYDGKLKDPDFSTNPDANMFVTRIKEACKEGVNFAGHYTLVYWGCGTACQNGVVVDRKTGVIYSGFNTSLGVAFRKNSNYIIFNAGEDELSGDYSPLDSNRFVQITLHVWEAATFKAVD